jgi:hypothetical protein
VIRLSNQRKNTTQRSRPRIAREALAKLKGDGVNVDSLCRQLDNLSKFPAGNPGTLFTKFSPTDRKRIKALPRNFRADAALMKNPAFLPFAMLGASMLPGQDGRVNLLIDLPKILEDIAQAVEHSLEQSPDVMSFATKITWIVEKVKQESRSGREHYQEILDILNPQNSHKMTYEALKNMVARERKRQARSR